MTREESQILLNQLLEAHRMTPDRAIAYVRENISEERYIKTKDTIVAAAYALADEVIKLRAELECRT